MCNKILHMLVYGCIIFSVNHANAQTFWSDNFEDAGSPSSGSRMLSIAEISCTSPAIGYFKRSTGSELSAGFTGFTNTRFFAAMNIDVGPTCVNTSAQAGQTITWSGIDITGKTGLSFKGLFGAFTGAVFQGLPFAASGNQDSLVIQYRINGGAWTKIIGLYADLSSGGNAGQLRVDTDGDYIGDGTGMTTAMTELTANISGTGTTLDLRFNIFDNNSTPGSMAIDNFRLIQSGTLPVTWASFTARQQDKSMLLNWSTSTEQNTKEFAIQRKDETGIWTTISRLPASGSSNSPVNYSYADNAPSIGLNLYRILQTDLDGKESFSETRSVRFEKVQPSFTVLANPVVDGVLRVQVNKPVHLSLLNAEGKLIWSKQVLPGLLSVPVGNHLKGIYTLRSDNELRKIIIQ